MLKAISKAAGRMIASSRVRSKRVRSVKRHFLGMFGLVKPALPQGLNRDMEYKDPRKGVCQAEANDCKKL